MKQVIVTAVAAAVLGLALPAFAQNIAVVNGKPIPKSRLDALAAQIQKSGRQIPPEAQGELREAVITREVFMQEAQKRGLDATDDYRQRLELARQTMLIQDLFVDYAKTHPITDAEITGEYTKFVAANGGKEYRARHILVENEAEARAIITQIKRGGKFEDIAKAKSKDKASGINGGDLDWASPGNFVPEFSGAMVKLGKGQVGAEPVKSEHGWHVIRVDDVREAQLPKIEDIRPQIVQQLQQQKLAQYQEELRSKAKVE